MHLPTKKSEAAAAEGIFFETVSTEQQKRNCLLRRVAGRSFKRPRNQTVFVPPGIWGRSLELVPRRQRGWEGQGEAGPKVLP